MATAQRTHVGASAVHGAINDRAIEPLTTASSTSASRFAGRHSSTSKEANATATASPVIPACHPCIAHLPHPRRAGSRHGHRRTSAIGHG
jgi:hypothetical protein